MKRYIFILPVAVALTLFLITLTSASMYNPVFNGVWRSGTTLYTDRIHVVNSFISGKDVYPINKPVATRVCNDVNITYYQPVCEKSERTFKCRLVKMTKVVAYCRTVREPILCINNNRIYGNVLKLDNFQYSSDGGLTWQRIPYNSWSDPSIKITDAYIQFRVSILEVCSPAFYINKAIIIDD